MKERWKRIRTGLLIILFSVIGLLSYIQLMQSFDLPLVLLIVPVTCAIAMIVLKRWSFLVPVCTILLSCMTQILAGDANAITQLQTDALSVTIILIQCLSILIVLEFVGLGCGSLIRVLMNRKKKLVVGIICCVLGVVIAIGPYIALFGNPLYPIVARQKLTSYADEHFTDYAIAEKKVYYSMQKGDYECRVSMADGKIRIVYFDDAGNADTTDK